MEKTRHVEYFCIILKSTWLTQNKNVQYFHTNKWSRPWLSCFHIHTVQQHWKCYCMDHQNLNIVQFQFTIARLLVNGKIYLQWGRGKHSCIVQSPLAMPLLVLILSLTCASRFFSSLTSTECFSFSLLTASSTLKHDEHVKPWLHAMTTRLCCCCWWWWR